MGACMGRRKTHTPEEIVAKLRQVEALAAQGKPAAEAVRTIGVTEATYYRWRAEYGGLKLDQVRRLKELERENARLRKAVSDLRSRRSSRRRPLRENARPRPPPGLRRARRAPARRVGAQGLRGGGAAPFDAEEDAADPGRRGGADGGWGGAGQALRELRLTAPYRAAAGEARPPLARRRLLRPAAPRAPRPRVGVRLRRRPHARRPQVPDALRGG